MHDYDLSTVIIGGELYTKTKNHVAGWVLLADRPTFLHLELTGNVCDALAGRTVRFYHPTKRPCFEKRISTLGGMDDDRQVGVMAHTEFNGNMLQLNWYSQSGYIGTTLRDFVVELDPSDPVEDCIQFEDHFRHPEKEWFEDTQCAGSNEFPDNLDASYHAFAEEMDRLEDILENPAQGVRIGSLFDEHGWESPDQLTEKTAQKLMITMLATLARFNVSFHMCPKCTWKHAYQLIYEELADQDFYPGMKGSDCFSHYSAQDLCKPCIKEYEAEWG